MASSAYDGEMTYRAAMPRRNGFHQISSSFHEQSVGAPRRRTGIRAFDLLAMNIGVSVKRHLQRQWWR